MASSGLKQGPGVPFMHMFYVDSIPLVHWMCPQCTEVLPVSWGYDKLGL